MQKCTLLNCFDSLFVDSLITIVYIKQISYKHISSCFAIKNKQKKVFSFMRENLSEI